MQSWMIVHVAWNWCRDNSRMVTLTAASSDDWNASTAAAALGLQRNNITMRTWPMATAAAAKNVATARGLRINYVNTSTLMVVLWTPPPRGSRDQGGVNWPTSRPAQQQQQLPWLAASQWSGHHLLPAIIMLIGRRLRSEAKSTDWATAAGATGQWLRYISTSCCCISKGDEGDKKLLDLSTGIACRCQILYFMHKILLDRGIIIIPFLQSATDKFANHKPVGLYHHYDMQSRSWWFGVIYSKYKIGCQAEK